MEPVFATLSSGREWRIALLDRPRHLSYEDVADEFYASFSRHLEQTDILLLRPPVDEMVEDPCALSAGLEAVAERAPRASLHLLYSWNFDIRLGTNVNHRVTDRITGNLDTQALLSWLRETELKEYVRRSSALLQAQSNFIYRAPSNTYVNMFLRAGSVQMTRQALDARSSFGCYLF